MATTSDASGMRHGNPELKQSVEHLRTDLRTVAHDAADVARAGVGELRQGASHAVDVAKEKFDEAADVAAEATESVRGIVARHPIASIGIAAGVGIVLGMLICRPRN